MSLLRRIVRVIESVSDMITLRHAMLALALISTVVVTAHIVYAVETDQQLLGDGLVTFFYVIISYAWTSCLVVCCRDHIRATAAADRDVLMAEVASLRRVINDIANEKDDAQLYPIGYGRANDGRSQRESINTTRN